MPFNFDCGELKVKVCSFVEIHARLVEWIYYCVFFRLLVLAFSFSEFSYDCVIIV